MAYRNENAFIRSTNPTTSTVTPGANINDSDRSVN